MARAKSGFACHHHTTMVSYQIHHVWPKEFDGPNTKDNKVQICPNAHSDIHFLMDHMLAAKPYNWREFGPGIRRLAQIGFDQIIAHPKALLAWTQAYHDGRTSLGPVQETE